METWDWNNPWKSVSFMLHTKDDLPDALLLNGFQNMKFLNATRQEHRLDLKKKMNRRESTRKVPCVQYRDAAGFSNLGGLAVMWWALSAPLVVIGLTELSMCQRDN